MPEPSAAETESDTDGIPPVSRVKSALARIADHALAGVIGWWVADRVDQVRETDGPLTVLDDGSVELGPDFDVEPQDPVPDELDLPF